MAAYKTVAYNGGWDVLRDEIVSGDCPTNEADLPTNEAALEAVVDRAAALIGLADNTTDDKKAAALLDLAAEQIELAESQMAPQQQQQSQPKKS